MEKWRRALWLFTAVLISKGAGACVPPLDGTRLESQRFGLAYKATPAVGQFFTLEVAVCSKTKEIAEAIKVDAHMPEHRHGMNYAPSLKPAGANRWRAEGLMFHMPGKWELVFEVRAAGKTDRMAHAMTLSEFSAQELNTIQSHGPWPPPEARDPSNRVSGKPEAIAFGEKLFFEPRLSGTGSVLCATCHVPFRAFQDSRPRAFGLQEVERRTGALVFTAPGIVPRLLAARVVVAVGVLVLLSVPALASQANVRALGAASLSCAAAERAMVLPT